MKRFLLFAVGAAMLICFAFTQQPLKAQVYTSYDSVTISIKSYEEIPIGIEEVLYPTDFDLPPFVGDPDFDDGYAKIDIGFDFEYNSDVYNTVWVCVNGFITFNDPLYTKADVSRGLFVDEPSTYPRNVIAPYWGDHVYRTDDEKFDGWMPSRISYGLSNNDSILTIQWKNLNINDKTVRSSVGNFQVKLYRSTDPISAQGNIEFCYGTVGGNPNTTLNTVITRNSSVGVKGESNDYLNGLFFDTDRFQARTNETYTNLWPPSGGTDRKIRFTAEIRNNIEEWWGDGDADFSKAEGARDFGKSQNGFVTINDVLKIVRASATGIPLDSIRRREAYHGDVNHNGRYYYDNSGIRTDIPWKDMRYSDNLPEGINSIKRIFYQTTEYDASLILHYLGARVPELPWLLDSFPQYGKITVDENIANGIMVGEVKNEGDNIYSIPIYLNGYFNGPVGSKFKLNTNVIDVTTNPTDGNQISAVFNGSTVVIAATGEFDASKPICVVKVNANNKEVNISDIRFNDVKIGNISGVVPETSQADELLIVDTYSQMAYVNADEDVPYELNIIDLLGNTIKTFDTSAKGPYLWDGTDNNGNIVQSGVYIYRLIGQGISASKKIILNK